jgi:hypothetical protein
VSRTGTSLRSQNDLGHLALFRQLFEHRAQGTLAEFLMLVDDTMIIFAHHLQKISFDGWHLFLSASVASVGRNASFTKSSQH